MGRIDEAMRRAGGAGVLPAQSPRPSNEGDVFVSPWSFRENVIPGASVEVDAPEERASAPSAALASFAAPELRTVIAASIRNGASGWSPNRRRITCWSSSSGSSPRRCTRRRPNGNTQRRHGDQRAAGDGKSLTAVNLALTLSESYGRRVLLVDADLRRPSLHETAQVPNVRGSATR